MILYVNGDSHSVGHGTASQHGMTINDPIYSDIDEAPHPANLPLSYGAVVAQQKNWNLVCQAKSGGSLDRAIRTTKQFVYQTMGDLFVLIGVPSFEREEWLHNGIWYQINSGGHEVLPDALQERYKKWVIEKDNAAGWWDQQSVIHNKLYAFHQWLNKHNVKHLFFNTAQPFTNTTRAGKRYDTYNWDEQYFEPYGPSESLGVFCNWCLSQGFTHDSWGHFGTDAHQAWAENLLPNLNRIIEKHD